MSIREIVNIVTVALTFLFPFWKLVAMVMGFCYRYKWVRAVDAAALSVIVGLYVFIHVHWRALYNPNSIFPGIFNNFIAIVSGLSVLFTCLSYLIDNARREMRGSHNRTDAGE